MSVGHFVYSNDINNSIYKNLTIQNPLFMFFEEKHNNKKLILCILKCDWSIIILALFLLAETGVRLQPMQKGRD